MQHVSKFEKILRSEGDNPDHPYCIRAAYTGTAASNIQGQTLHSAFSFNFGNTFLSLSDKARDEKRSLLQNLKIVFVDEYSMIPADMLYQLDLRLKEIKQKTNVPFGGVSIFLLGDILQLRPVLGKFICEIPKSESYHLAYLAEPLWEKFRVILLVQNHRQGEDGEYANILNRIRDGRLSEDDQRVLETRVRPINHTDIPKDALFVTCTNAEVNRINDEAISVIKGTEYILEAVVCSKSHKCVKTITERSGAVRNTPLQKTLKLKVGAKIMLTHNLDVNDSLTNGTFGEVIGFNFDRFGNIAQVNVHFSNEESGRELRMNYTDLQRKFQGISVTPIHKIEFPYCMSKTRNKHESATVLQFPLKLAFAATAHKIQGQTVCQPRSLVVDLRTVREAAQAYVILSRVQSLSQLFIVDSLCPSKIYSSAVGLQELERQRSVAMNNEAAHSCIVSCNIRSLSRHINDLSSSSYIKYAEVVCLQETWLKENEDYGNRFEMVGMEHHFVSVGQGKGVATYCRQDFTLNGSIKKQHYQVIRVSSKSTDVINIYRSSSDGKDSLFVEDLLSLFDGQKQTYIVGDFNLCYITERNNKIFREIELQGFKQLLKEPTHIEGRQIDLVFHYSMQAEHHSNLTVFQFGQYFTDHDLIKIVFEQVRHNYICLNLIKCLLE